jgi:hypothetical protein
MSTTDLSVGTDAAEDRIDRGAHAARPMLLTVLVTELPSLRNL